MKHEDLKVGMKVKRVLCGNMGCYTSTIGATSTVSNIYDVHGVFSTGENPDVYFDARYFEPVEDIKEEETMQYTNKNLITMDKKYKTRCGYPVRVLCVDRKDSMFPVIAVYEENGFEVVAYYNSKGLSTTDECLDLIEVSPYEDFKKDDKVMVSTTGVVWYKRYFSHESDGVPYAFNAGATSWSSEYDAVDWEFCRKPTQEELGE